MKKKMFFGLAVLSLSVYAHADEAAKEELMEIFDKGAPQQNAFFISDADLSSTTATTPSATPTSMKIDQDYPGRNVSNELYAGQPYPKHGIHLAAFGEFLYWNSGFYGHCAQLDFTGTSQVVVRELSNFNTHYQPGFRIGVQETFEAQGWDLVFDWTCFHNSKSKTFLKEGDQFVDLDWGNTYNEDVTPSNDRSTYHAKFSQLNLRFGKEVYFSKYYGFHPNIGARYVSLKDGFKMHYYDLTDSQVNDISMDNNLHGFGLSAGVGNKFLLGYGLSLTGSFDACLSYLTKTLRYKGIANQLTGSFYGINVSQPGHDVIPIIDMKVDLNWERSFMNEKIALGLNLGYEYHVLINGFTMLSGPESGFILLLEDLNTNFYMMGMTLGAKLSF